MANFQSLQKVAIQLPKLAVLMSQYLGYTKYCSYSTPNFLCDVVAMGLPASAVVCMYVCLLFTSYITFLTTEATQKRAASSSANCQFVYICMFSLIQDLSILLNLLALFSVLNSIGNWFHTEDVLATKLFLVT